MRGLMLITSLVAGTCLAAETQHGCDDPGLNSRWHDALARYPEDRLVLRLFAERDTLCRLVRDGTISFEKAQAQWEQALTDGLLDRARAEERKRGLLPLFSTF